MRKAKRIFIVAFALALLLVATACGSKTNDTSKPSGDISGTDSAVTTTPSTEKENAFDLSSVDYSNPSVVVELDDAAAMETLMQDMANMRIEEGTVVKVTGKASTTRSTSLMAKKDDGGSIGVALTVEGDWEAPQNGTVVEAVGVIVKGQYSMEFHVLPQNIKS